MSYVQRVYSSPKSSYFPISGPAPPEGLLARPVVDAARMRQLAEAVEAAHACPLPTTSAPDPNRARNRDVYDRLGFTDFVEPLDVASLRRLLFPAKQYTPSDRTPASERDLYRNVTFRVLDWMNDRTLHSNPNHILVSRTIGMRDGNARTVSSLDMDGTEDFFKAGGDKDNPCFRPNLLAPTIQKYALELTAFILFLLRVTPSVHRPTTPTPPLPERAPLPTFIPADPEGGITYSCNYPELPVTMATVPLIQAFRRVVLQDVHDCPHGIQGGKGLPPSPAMAQAIPTLLLSLFSAKYKGNPGRGVTPHDQFVVISSLLSREEGVAHQDVRMFSPRLAAFEYVFRIVAYRTILAELPDSPITEMTPEELSSTSDASKSDLRSPVPFCSFADSNHFTHLTPPLPQTQPVHPLLDRLRCPLRRRPRQPLPHHPPGPLARHQRLGRLSPRRRG